MFSSFSLRSLARSACGVPAGFEGGLPFWSSRPPLWCLPVALPAAGYWCALLPLSWGGWLALLGALRGPRSFFWRFF